MYMLKESSAGSVVYGKHYSAEDYKYRLKENKDIEQKNMSLSKASIPESSGSNR